MASHFEKVEKLRKTHEWDLPLEGQASASVCVRCGVAFVAFAQHPFACPLPDRGDLLEDVDYDA